MTDKEIRSQGYNSLAEECSSKLDAPSAAQIIIDGVDVCECKRFMQKVPNTTRKNICQIFDSQYQCTMYPNCEYKQLQREKQKNKELTEEIRTLKEQGGILLAERNAMEIGRDELKQKNKELQKRLNNCSENWGKDALMLDWYKQSDQAKQEENFNLTMKVEEYKQALKEIGEIAEKLITEICSHCGWNNSDSCEGDSGECTAGFIKKQILQKVKEVTE